MLKIFWAMFLCSAQLLAMNSKQDSRLPFQPASSKAFRSERDKRLTDKGVKIAQVECWNSERDLILNENLVNQIPKTSSSLPEIKLRKKSKKNTLKRKSLKPAPSGFELRKEVYKFNFFGSSQSQISVPQELINSVIFTVANANSRNEAYGYLRESGNFSNIYPVFRAMLKEAAKSEITEAASSDLAFLSDLANMTKIISEQLKEFESDSELKRAMLAKFSSAPGAVKRQNDFLEFLHQQMMPIVRASPSEILDFFAAMLAAAQEASKSFNDKLLNMPTPAELLSANFFLYIVIPSLKDYRLSLVEISDQDYLAYEAKQLLASKLKKIPSPKNDAKAWAEFVGEVSERIKIDKLDYLQKTYAGDLERANAEAILHKLMMKIFADQNSLSPNDFRGDMWSFYHLFVSEPLALDEYKAELSSVLFKNSQDLLNAGH